MPQELQPEQEKEPQQQQEERTENAAQAYMRHLLDIRQEQTEQAVMPAKAWGRGFPAAMLEYKKETTN